MIDNKIQLESYKFLGLDYKVKINSKQYSMRELSDNMIDKLLNINENDRNRKYSDEMIYIFKDVKKIRRKQKLEKIKNLV